jgi:hypothetical protein
MLQLRTRAQYKITIAFLESYRSKFMIIQSLNIRSLVSHFEDVFAYPNLKTSHFSCLNETKVTNLDINFKNYNSYHKNSKCYLAILNMAPRYFMMIMFH